MFSSLIPVCLYRKKNYTICRHNFMDSVFNWKAILGKPVQMSFISLLLQSCSAGATGSL